ncbi:hypothetical protein GCM10010193_05800 [Kitasatospora atroaurantiaca]|uniref:Uncharacterized protein DUF4173 n=1 Tax=Kitasatospora atroaurantiaca TaxID=285545 RepID=A0A561EW69_9ACTN|nr:DUF4173 domain-containing protein [Kitasatospora atroaurantiaca]TWE19884.1 uncharacterized protein DUF4173 [Kitasatospora atroaurantiaca]
MSSPSAAAPPPRVPNDPYRPPVVPSPLQPPAWMKATEPRKPTPVPGVRVVAAGLAAGLVSAAVLADGIGVNLLICALIAAVAAGLAGRSAGRQVRPWTVLWGVVALLLLVVPVLTDAGWPTFLAIVTALGIGSLALHGGSRWAGVLLGPLGFWAHLVPSVPWAAMTLRDRQYPARERILPVLKASAVALGLLVVFGALFASADAAMGELFGDLMPSADVGDLPLRVLMFAVGLVVALGAAHTAASPRRWDRLPVAPGRERGRVEWALPLIALNLLFGAFAAVQLVVFVDGYQAILRKPGLIPSEYARQGFWQLLWVTVLTLVVVALAKRWAPRRTAGDRLLVKGLLGLLCALTLVVVASALYRMQLYVDAFGLTRLRISVAAVELWLGVVFLLVIAGGVLSSRRWLPRAVVLSAALAVGVFGLLGPDALIAEQNVARYEKSGKLDVGYLRELSADAVPALDRLPDDRRTCALQLISQDLSEARSSWYSTSLAEARARDILRKNPVAPDGGNACLRAGFREDYLP